VARVEIREAELGDHGWVLERHAYLFEDQEAWGEPFIAMIARLVADYLEDNDPEREAAWVAELDGRRVGSVYCVRRSDEARSCACSSSTPRRAAMASARSSSSAASSSPVSAATSG
jgi:hypothetical protein